MLPPKTLDDDGEVHEVAVSLELHCFHYVDKLFPGVLCRLQPFVYRHSQLGEVR